MGVAMIGAAAVHDGVYQCRQDPALECLVGLDLALGKDEFGLIQICLWSALFERRVESLADTARSASAFVN
jgi:hypothetical protein